MKYVSTIRKQLAVLAFAAIAMLSPNYAFAGNSPFDKCKHPSIVNDHCTGCDSYVIEYDYTANNNGAAKQGIKLNSTAGDFGDAVYLGTDQVGGKWYWFFDRVVTHIESGAFDKNKMEISISEVSLPEGVTTLDPDVFAGCVTLENITLPSTLTSIGSGAFSGCTSLESVVIPEGVTTIEPNAFQGCSSLESVTIPSTVTSIGAGAFSGCSDLDSIAIPESVTSIGAGAFSGCSDLTSVVIPENVTTVGDNAFSGCTSLTTVVVESENTEISNSSFSGSNNISDVSGTIPQIEVITNGNVSGNSSGDSSQGGGSQTTPPNPAVSSLNVDVLTDASYLNLKKEYPNAVISFQTYERSVVGSWSTLCLPFAVSPNENVKFYQLSSVDFNNGVLVLSEITEEVPANTPCIFQNLSNNTTLSFKTLEPVSFPTEDIVKPLSVEGWTMIGSYVRQDVYVTEENPNLYYIASDKFKHANGCFVLNPFRAYFKYDGEVSSSAAIRLSCEVAENATSLNSFEKTQEEGVLYDLLCNRVDQMVKGSIYIINGKKVIFK